MAEVNGPPPGPPPDLDLALTIDRAALARVIRIVAARHGPLELGPVVGGDSERAATWRHSGELGELEWRWRATLRPGWSPPSS